MQKIRGRLPRFRVGWATNCGISGRRIPFRSLLFLLLLIMSACTVARPSNIHGCGYDTLIPFGGFRSNTTNLLITHPGVLQQSLDTALRLGTYLEIIIIASDDRTDLIRFRQELTNYYSRDVRAGRLQIFGGDQTRINETVRLRIRRWNNDLGMVAAVVIDTESLRIACLNSLP